MEGQRAMESVTGIEISPRWRLSGPLHLAYRANKIDIEVSGQTRLGSWNKPEFFAVPAGRHEVKVSCKPHLGGATHMHTMTTVLVEGGKVTQLDYTVPATFLGTLANGFNRGKLVQTGIAPGTMAVITTTATPASAPADCVAARSTTACSKCHHPLPAEARFCHECGAPASEPSGMSGAMPTKVCAKCAHRLPVEAKFCHECGTSVPV